MELKTKVMAHENFNTYKASFIEWCKQNSACQDEFEKVLASQNEAELLAVIHANFNWCMGESFDANGLKVAFGDDVLFSAKIIIGDISGKSVTEGIWHIYSSQVEARGSSQVEARGSSQVKAYNSSQVKAYNSSQVKAYNSSKVKAYNSSKVEAYNSSQVEARGSSQVEAWDSSQVEAYNLSKVEAYHSSQVKAWDSSQVKAYNSSKVEAYHSSQVKACGYAIVHVRKNGHKIELGDNWKIEDISIVS